MKNLFGKPKVLVTVLSTMQHWVHPCLVPNLIQMSHDSRFTVEIEMVIDKCPVDYARNSCVVMARERKADFLFMIDADQSMEVNALDVLNVGLSKDVIGLPTMQNVDLEKVKTADAPIYPNFRTLARPERDGELFTVDRIGTGAMFINRRVWEKVRGPWFKFTQCENDELRAITMGEDFYFCELVQRHGFKIWSHTRVISHWKVSEVSRLGMFFETARQMAPNGGHAPAKVEWGKVRG